MDFSKYLIPIAALWLGGMEPAGAAPPESLGFVGNLSSTVNGVPYTGTVDLKVSFYDLVSAGNLLHSECFSDTSVNQGRFGMQLGSIQPFQNGLGKFLQTNPSLFIELQVCDPATQCASGCDDPLSPRLSLASEPFAAVASTLQGLSPTNLLQITGNSSPYVINKSALDVLLGTSGVQDASSLHQHDSLYMKLGTGGSVALTAGAFLGLGTRTADPTSLTAGDAGKTWYDSTTKSVKFWNGTSTITLGSVSGGGTVLTSASNLDASKITSGTLILSADPTSSMGAVTKQYVDAAIGSTRSPWGSTNSNDIYYNLGKVGIGTTSPSAVLETFGETKLRANSSNGLVISSSWSYAIGGTASVTTGSTTVAGTGTAFSSALSVGDFVQLQSPCWDYAMVTAISSDTSLTLAKPIICSTGTYAIARVPVAVKVLNYYSAPLLTIDGMSGDLTTVGSVYAGANVAATGLVRMKQGAVIGNAFFGATPPSSGLAVEGSVGIGTTTPTALLQIKAGGSGAGSAPLKFTSGTLLANPEDGAMEYDGTNFFVTSGTTRRAIASGASQGILDSVATINNGNGGITLTPSAANSVIINSTTASSSSSTGALIVSGGEGVSGNLNVGGTISTTSLSGNSVTTGTLSATNSVTTPSIFGSSTPNGNLLLDSTSHGTKGSIFIAPSGGKVGIGTTAPSKTLEVKGDIQVGALSIGHGGTGNTTNLAIGSSALMLNTSGFSNTALGYAALATNSTGADNTAVGYAAMALNSGGFYNTGVGYGALNANSSGIANSAFGHNSQLYANGSYNTAFGAYSMLSGSNAANNTASYNTALGYGALAGLTTGSGNVAIGVSAGSVISSGSYNVVIGGNNGAGLSNGSGNILIADGQGTERMRFNSNGYLGIGTSAPIAPFHYSRPSGNSDLIVTSENGNAEVLLTGPSTSYFPGVALAHVSGALQLMTVANGSPNSSYPWANLSGASGTFNWTAISGSPTEARMSLQRGNGLSAIPSGTALSRLSFDGYNGSGYSVSAAAIQGVAAENFSNTANGTHLLFHTTASTTNAPQERMRISQAGNVGIGTTGPSTRLQVAGEISPASDNTFPLGDATLRFSAVYAVNGTIQTSDARQKRDVRDSDLGLDFINRLRPVSYYWNSGSDSELHYGLIAQEADSAIRETKSEIGRPLRPNESTIVTHDSASDRYGLKYSELIAPVIGAIQELYRSLRGVEANQERIEKLETENAALKKENSDIKLRLDRLEKSLGISNP